jgi:hypothetical protein
MRGDIVASGFVLWITAFALFFLTGTGHFGLIGALEGLVIAGFFGFVGLVLVIFGFVSYHAPRTCYVCGMVLTSDRDYKLHFQSNHPDKQL